MRTESRVGQTLAEANDAAKARQRSEPMAAPSLGTLYILDFNHPVTVHTNRSALVRNRSPGRDQPEPLKSP